MQRELGIVCIMSFYQKRSVRLGGRWRFRWCNDFTAPHRVKRRSHGRGKRVKVSRESWVGRRGLCLVRQDFVNWRLPHSTCLRFFLELGWRRSGGGGGAAGVHHRCRWCKKKKRNLELLKIFTLVVKTKKKKKDDDEDLLQSIFSSIPVAISVLFFQLNKPGFHTDSVNWTSDYISIYVSFVTFFCFAVHCVSTCVCVHVCVLIFSLIRL